VSAVDGIGCILLCGIVEVAFAYAKKFEKYFQQNASKKKTQQIIFKAFTWGGIRVDQ